MDSLHDLLQTKVNNLNDSTRGDISLAQLEMERLYPGQIKVSGIKDGIMFLHTPNASIASEARMQQIHILHTLNSCLKTKIAQVRILIR